MTGPVPEGGERATLSLKNDLRRPREVSFVSLALNAVVNTRSRFFEVEEGFYTAIIGWTAGGFVGGAVGDAWPEGHVRCGVKGWR